MGLGDMRAQTLISLISETMMGAFKAFHLVIKELLSEGVAGALSIFNQALIRKLISSSVSALGGEISRRRDRNRTREKRDVELLRTYLVLMGLVCFGSACVCVHVKQPPELQRFHYYRRATGAEGEEKGGDVEREGSLALDQHQLSTF